MEKVWLVGAFGMLGKAIGEVLKKNDILFKATGSDVDITDINILNQFVGDENFSHIINTAAYTNVEKAEIDRERAFDVNVNGIKNLVNIANRMDSKIIHFSTDYVFDGELLLPYLEDNLTNPINYYGMTKLEGEKILLSSARNKILIRTSWLFGFSDNNFVFKIFEKILKENEINVVDDQRGRLTYCEDLAKGAFELSAKEGIFHLANDDEASWYEIACFIFSWMKKHVKNIKCKKVNKVSSNDFKTLAKRPKYSVLDLTKSKEITSHLPSWRKSLIKHLEILYARTKTC